MFLINLASLYLGQPLTYFLEVGARISLKVVTKGFLRGKNTLKIYILKVVFLKRKRRSATKKIEVSLINLQSLTKYLGVILVFIRNSVLQEKFNFCFSRFFTSINKNCVLVGRLGTRLLFYQVSRLSLYFLIS